MNSSPYDDYTPPAGGGGQYLKFEDNVPVKLRIVSEPMVFNSTFSKGEKIQISTRYAWTVWNYDDQMAQVMVLPVTAFRILLGLTKDEDWGDPTTYNVKVTRTGTGLKTRYTINPSVAKEPLGEDEQNEIKGIDLKKAIEASPSASTAMTLQEAKASNHQFGTPAKQDKVYDDVDDDEPINLDDIPF